MTRKHAKLPIIQRVQLNSLLFFLFLRDFFWGGGGGGGGGGGSLVWSEGDNEYVRTTTLVFCGEF